MNIVQTTLPGVLLIDPDRFQDERGEFLEVYQQQTYHRLGIDVTFVQDNLSISRKNVIRGLHFQLPPYEQAKLVRVDFGAVMDVVVDLRRGSPTYGKYITVILTAENRLQLFIPAGFAHGFAVLENNTVFAYKCSNFYSKDHDCVIRWDDPDLSIPWGITDPIVSLKDRNGMFFREFDSPFVYSIM